MVARRRGLDTGVAAHLAAQRQDDSRRVQRVLGQGVVEPASELALQNRHWPGEADKGTQAAVGEGEESSPSHRTEVRKEESRMGRFRIRITERPDVGARLGDRCRMGMVVGYLSSQTVRSALPEFSDPNPVLINR